MAKRELSVADLHAQDFLKRNMSAKPDSSYLSVGKKSQGVADGRYSASTLGLKDGSMPADTADDRIKSAGSQRLSNHMYNRIWQVRSFPPPNALGTGQPTVLTEEQETFDNQQMKRRVSEISVGSKVTVAGVENAIS